MGPKKKGSSKKSGNIEPVETLAESLKDRMTVRNARHAAIGEKMQRGDHDAIFSGMSSEIQSRQKKLQDEAEKELAMKLVCQKLGLEKGGRRDDGDQSKLKGDKAQVLRNQWGGGMDYNPAHPGNSHLSGWLRALWRGDYEAVMGFIQEVKEDEVSQLLEVRESLLNVSAVFHVIIGARTLCGKNPLFRDIQLAASRMMEVKNEHQQILTKLLELGANIHAKDVAGYTPLHHCLTSYSNPTTMSMARQLLKAGADPNLQNRFGCTPLFEPVMAANLDAVKLLLEFGADPDIKENDAGISCRYTATFLPKISELFCQADKRKAKKVRANAKDEAGGSLRLCKVCGVDDDNKRCTGCYMVWYCGEKCQHGDWANHKEECKVTRKQYRQFVLVDEKTGVRSNITKKTHVKNVGELPSKKHFVVKVQVTFGSGATDSDPMLIYNKDKSLCGNLHRQGQEEVFDMLFRSIKGEGGYKGLKGYFYAIHSGEVNKEGKLIGIVMKINPEKILPLETW